MHLLLFDRFLVCGVTPVAISAHLANGSHRPLPVSVPGSLCSWPPACDLVAEDSFAPQPHSSAGLRDARDTILNVVSLPLAHCHHNSDFILRMPELNRTTGLLREEYMARLSKPCART
jgi:hypothetical protein